MNRDKYKEAKKTSQEIEQLLQSDNLTADDRQKLKEIHAQLSGVLLSPWLPFDWRRRAIMFFLLLLGLYGITNGQSYFALSWLFLALFSPRIVGEGASILGKILGR
ncbi:MAG: hypothetical protein EPN23_11135 [Verrucomicrobia bacterium]|nr:MAG: hypothetical protein EPN23_11135 [Verrucomicrobiota bacterium]